MATAEELLEAIRDQGDRSLTMIAEMQAVAAAQREANRIAIDRLGTAQGSDPPSGPLDILSFADKGPTAVKDVLDDEADVDDYLWVDTEIEPARGGDFVVDQSPTNVGWAHNLRLSRPPVCDS